MDSELAVVSHHPLLLLLLQPFVDLFFLFNPHVLTGSCDRKWIGGGANERLQSPVRGGRSQRTVTCGGGAWCNSLLSVCF